MFVCRLVLRQRETWILAAHVKGGVHFGHSGKYGLPVSLTSWAVANSERFLSPLGARWSHVRQVGEKARLIVHVVPPDDRDLLVAAAYLHDIGYAPELATTGFHPLDGARWIRDHGPGGRLARLVAHHSCAVYEAEVRGLRETLLSEFEPEDSATYDALVFCDLTTGPTGESLSFDERISDIYERYGPDHEVTHALGLSRPALESCCARTLARLEGGLTYVWFCALFEIMLDAQPNRGVHPEIRNRIGRHKLHLGGFAAGGDGSTYHARGEADREFLPDFTVIVSRDVIRV